MARPWTRFRARRGMWLLSAAGLLLLCTPRVQGQITAGTVGKGEFPGLQLLPPGSVLCGISLPRYEDHRVTALFTADRMEIKSRSLVYLAGVKVHLYDKDGGITDLESNAVYYNFSTSRVVSNVPTSLASPRMEAQGRGLVFDNEKRIGIIKGPVNSAIRSDHAGSVITAPQEKKP